MTTNIPIMDNCFSTLLNDAQFWSFLTDLRIAMAWAKVVCISTRKRGRPLSFTSALIQYNPRHIHPSRPTTTERSFHIFIHTIARTYIYTRGRRSMPVCLSLLVFHRRIPIQSTFHFDCPSPRAARNWQAFSYVY